VKDFYVPMVKPSEKHQLLAARILAVILGFVPVPFALYVPGLVKTVFFARALRASLAVIVLLGFYAPRMKGGSAAAISLVVTAACTTVWYALKNPFGVDNIYIAVAVPLFWMLASNMFRRSAKEENKHGAAQAG
jgi:SSS family solute:Na+ symporter